MGLMFITILIQIWKRCQIWRRLNRLERIKMNGIRRKHRLRPIVTLWDRISCILCLPFRLVFGLIDDFYERLVTSVGSRSRGQRMDGHMSRVFKNYTEENKLFRKVLYFLFGLLLSYLAFLFIYHQHFLNNYSMIITTIGLTVIFTLMVPFSDSVLCLTLIALPSLFSSKIRYILVAYIWFVLYFNVVPNIWNNGKDGIRSFGCSVWQTADGGKKLAEHMIQDIKDFIRDMKQKMRDIVDNLKAFAKKFDLNLGLPSINLKSLCNEPNDDQVYDCEDKLTMFSIKQHRVFPPLICTNLWKGFAKLCQGVKETMNDMYNKARNEVMETIKEIERELYFDVDLNHDLDYHYNTSKHISEQLDKIGRDFFDRHYLLPYFRYLFNIKIFALLLITFWIIIISVVYRYRYLKSDPFDNTYINEELLKIDRKRAESQKETIIPLEMRERQHFIYPFDPIMTKVETQRFILGFGLMMVTLAQIIIYFGLDYGVYSLLFWYNKFIDILCDMLAPAAVRLDYKSNAFIAKRLNRLNDAFDLKKKIVERLQECKSVPMLPDGQIYKEILIYLILIVGTLFSSSYGLRFRHYFAGLFHPHRVPVRAVWLYNNILCRRGNIFQFWRKQMRAKVFGERVGEEDISFLDRLCAQSVTIRVLCTFLGFYGKYKYCNGCGHKVKIDGTDQSVVCAHKCGAIYCFDCLGDRNNICSVCMNPIDYSQIGDLSEELDSSEEDIAYDLRIEDFLYQYSGEREKTKKRDDIDEYEQLSALQRRDLVTLAYKYDTVDRVPVVVYLVDDDGYDAEDESDDTKDYQKYLFGLEQELGIPAEHILRMRDNAKQLTAEDIDRSLTNKVREEKASQIKREEDQRLVRNALLMINRDRRKYIKKSKNKFN